MSADPGALENLDFLRNLLKDQPYVALAYMTGILPVKKYGLHSALKMFREYSMTNQRNINYDRDNANKPHSCVIERVKKSGHM